MFHTQNNTVDNQWDYLMIKDHLVVKHFQELVETKELLYMYN